ncbi:sensory box histidine kinase [Filimonas lacunae]|nr:sensory box histidine kinase [Filimonas lacunae]
MLFLFPLAASAQQLTRPEGSNLQDTAAIHRLLKTGRSIKHSFPDSAFYYFNKALIGSYGANYSEGVVLAQYELSRWYYNSNIQLSINSACAALTEFEKEHLTNNTLKCQVYLALAKAYEANAKIDSAAYYYYYLNEEVDKGRIKDPYFEVSLYTTLALFWLNSDNQLDPEFAKPLKNFIDKAQHTLNQLPDNSSTNASFYQLQAIYYLSINRYDSARFYLQKQLALCENTTPMPSSMASVLLNISNAYVMEHKPGEAIPYINRVRSTYKSIPTQDRYYITANLHLADVYFQQKKYGECIRILDSTWHYCKVNFVNKDVADAYKIYGDSYEKLGMKDQALTYKNLYITLYDSLAKRDRLNMSYKMESRYRLAEKDKKLAEQNLTISQAENDARRKNFWVAAISFLAILMILVAILWLRNIRHAQRLQTYQFEKQMEISRLTYTIQGEEKERRRIAAELHDGIVGLLVAAKINLNLVKKEYHFSNESNFTEGLQLIDQAASDLRKTAHNMMPEILMQDGLLKALEQFCNSIAANNTTSIYFEIVGTPVKLKSSLELALYRIVQELVHNIIKHARATEAMIQINFFENELSITVEDNGVGMDVHTTTQGIGIKSIYDRVKAINGNITIESGYSKGTSIYINLDLHKENLETA